MYKQSRNEDTKKMKYSQSSVIELKYGQLNLVDNVLFLFYFIYLFFGYFDCDLLFTHNVRNLGKF